MHIYIYIHIYYHYYRTGPAKYIRHNIIYNECRPGRGRGLNSPPISKDPTILNLLTSPIIILYVSNPTIM